MSKKKAAGRQKVVNLAIIFSFIVAFVLSFFIGYLVGISKNIKKEMIAVKEVKKEKKKELTVEKLLEQEIKKHGIIQQKKVSLLAKKKRRQNLKKKPSTAEQQIDKILSRELNNSDNSGVKYFVQVGSFNVERDANDLKEKLKKQGFFVTVYQYTDYKDKVWYRVRLGPYKEKDKAQLVSKKLQQKTKLPTLIVGG